MIKNLLSVFCLVLFVFSCTKKEDISSINPVNWNKRKPGYVLPNDLMSGKTYLSVYSQIYSMTEHKTHNLTVTVSMRNTNRNDTVYVEKAEYFDTKGKLIRGYFNHPIYIAPLETVEIVIDEIDDDGGTGANFLFNWKTKPTIHEPLFESVMISTSSQQGISFTTQGKRIE